MYELRNQSKHLLDYLNLWHRYWWKLPVANPERVQATMKQWGLTAEEIEKSAPYQIEMCLLEVCQPSERIFDLDQAAEELHLSTAKKVEKLIKEGKLDSLPDGTITESSIADYLHVSKPQIKLQKRDALAVFISEICDHRTEMEFDFDGREWLPVSAKNEAATLWGQASILFMDLNRYPDRFKQCSDCGAFFWDASRNKSARYCDEPMCVNPRNLRNVNKYRRGETPGTHYRPRKRTRNRSALKARRRK